MCVVRSIHLSISFFTERKRERETFSILGDENIFHLILTFRYLLFFYPMNLMSWLSPWRRCSMFNIVSDTLVEWEGIFLTDRERTFSQIERIKQWLTGMAKWVLLDEMFDSWMDSSSHASLIPSPFSNWLFLRIQNLLVMNDFTPELSLSPSFFRILPSPLYPLSKFLSKTFFRSNRPQTVTSSTNTSVQEFSCSWIRRKEGEIQSHEIT